MRGMADRDDHRRTWENGLSYLRPRRRCPTCKSECKYVGRIFHDLRRSAVKHMDDAGISRDVAMSISGHKTDSMYSRYNICDLKRRRKALERVQEFRERMAVEQAQSNVIAMR